MLQKICEILCLNNISQNGLFKGVQHCHFIGKFSYITISRYNEGILKLPLKSYKSLNNKIL